MKNYIHIVLASVSLATLLIGCTYTGAIRTDIAPTALVVGHSLIKMAHANF
jgi:hypothetical protein